jgi:MFS transporter, OFA family, oxalate/formate antiporter
MTPSLADALALRLPHHYGWVVLACASAAAFARAGPAVATLSMFVAPMTSEFGWSRTGMSGAVSLGGILAALLSPAIGSLLDRRGPRLILGAAVLSTGVSLLLLSQIGSLIAFYVLFCTARMNFAGPFDLGIYGAISNWFVGRRAFAVSIANAVEKTGLVLLPLLAYAVISTQGWRTAWLVIGAVVLLVGFLPSWLLMIRRPEDIGQVPEGLLSAPTHGGRAQSSFAADAEPVFTRAEALRTRAFWMLSLFTLMVYPVQAGMSLHQAVHLIERGFSSGAAAASVGVLTLSSIVSTFAFGIIPRRIGVPAALAITGALLIGSALGMAATTTITATIVSAAMFGLGVGGLQVVLPVAWADYFGRRNFGAIRGVALTIQVTAQATGPLASGLLRDWTGDYSASLITFAVLSAIGAVAALLIKPPPFQAVRG